MWIPSVRILYELLLYKWWSSRTSIMFQTETSDLKLPNHCRIVPSETTLGLQHKFSRSWTNIFTFFEIEEGCMIKISFFLLYNSFSTWNKNYATTKARIMLLQIEKTEYKCMGHSMLHFISNSKLTGRNEASLWNTTELFA